MCVYIYIYIYIFFFFILKGIKVIKMFIKNEEPKLPQTSHILFVSNDIISILLFIKLNKKTIIYFIL